MKTVGNLGLCLYPAIAIFRYRPTPVPMQKALIKGNITLRDLSVSGAYQASSKIRVVTERVRASSSRIQSMPSYEATSRLAQLPIKLWLKAMLAMIGVTMQRASTVMPWLADARLKTSKIRPTTIDMIETISSERYCSPTAR